jgi:hypothetical protein
MEDALEADGRHAKPFGQRPAIYLLMLVVLAASIFAALEWRKHSMNTGVQTALAGETGAETVVYRRDLLGGNDIVFDVQSVSGDMSMVIMTRRLLKTAEALKDLDVGRVYLAYKGREKFYFDGAYFKQIGAERQWQNPVYTIRTMPENVHNLDGSSAFQSWSGGLIGVLGQQMNDVDEFHRRWWTDDALAELGN